MPGQPLPPELDGVARSGDAGHPQHHQHENFSNFFECFLAEQDRDLQALRAAAAAPPPPEEEQEALLRALVERVMGNYQYYYRAKGAAASRDVLPMFAPSWTSRTEILFIWVGGWRPTMAVQLLYSKSGLQVEAQLPALLRGEPTGDLADLSPEQLARADALHRRVVRLEQEISEEEAKAQESVADTEMVEVSHALTVGGGGGEGAMELAMVGKREAVRRVLERADELRLGTLEGVVEIMRPTQAVHFLIAAAELHLRLHEFGKTKDAAANGAVAESM